MAVSKRRVGGSGWAGVYGSFIGLAKATAKGSSGRLRSAKKTKLEKTDATPAKGVVELAMQSPDEVLSQAAKRVRAVQADIDSVKQRLSTLNSQLVTLTAALRRELDRVNGTDSPASGKRPKRSKA